MLIAPFYNFQSLHEHHITGGEILLATHIYFWRGGRIAITTMATNISSTINSINIRIFRVIKKPGHYLSVLAARANRSSNSIQRGDSQL
jgi:hypothetical protein